MLVHDVPVLVEGVGQRDGGRDVDLEDLLGGELVEHHDEGAQAVAVGGDQDTLAGLELRGDLVLEVRPRAGDAVLQALGARQLVLHRDVAILLGQFRKTLVAVLKRLGRHVEGATPDLDLLVTVLGSGLGLVHALQGAIVTLIELPALDDGQPLAVHREQNVVQRVDGALEVRGVADVEVVAGLLEGLAAVEGFLHASLREVHVGPASKEVCLVPLALAVTDDNEVHQVVFGHG